nr:MAG TPA: hypothetical protein [Caudoviricetes sp.]
MIRAVTMWSCFLIFRKPVKKLPFRVHLNLEQKHRKPF